MYVVWTKPNSAQRWELVDLFESLDAARFTAAPLPTGTGETYRITEHVVTDVPTAPQLELTVSESFFDRARRAGNRVRLPATLA